MGNLLALVAFALVATTFYLWFQRIQTVRVPENRTAFVVAGLAAALLGAFALLEGAGWLGMILSVVAMLGGVLFGVLVGISPQKTDGAIEEGDDVFAFVGDQAAALDDSGERVAMSTYRGTPVLIKFFRGHW